MESYEVRISSRIRKLTRKFPAKHKRQIEGCLNRLSDSPRPRNCKKLRNSGGYRVAVGEYRILYTIDDDARIVRVYLIVKRNDFSY